ncbi:spermidine synthase-like [Watersipora subatra]|uniref:spermidine synthase-like n=1 Tax=Watersipora subatra TaxID=2589382 RepID=UPI00355BC32C
MNALREGWFSDINEKMWPGQALSLRVEEVLFHEKSLYQDVMVLNTQSYGTVLVLDGCIQVTARDEFAYQEMCTFLPLNSHPNPEKVLVIGGGDGGVVREAVKHPKVKQVVLCEIDQMVIDVSKKYLPSMAVGLSSPKLELVIGDGFEYLKKQKDQFDVIITDSSDPENSEGSAPAAPLFQSEYFKLLSEALRDGGLTCSQGETIWFDLELIARLKNSCKEIFPVVDYGYVSIPTYIGGQIGFLLNSKNPETNFRKPVHRWTDEECEQLNLNYYTSEIHEAAFTLPRFARKRLS